MLAAHAGFREFLCKVDSSAPIPALVECLRAIGDSGILTQARLAAGCELAFAKADEVLAGNDVDGRGLNRIEIAAINFFTQGNVPPCHCKQPLQLQPLMVTLTTRMRRLRKSI